jgi:ATP-dependent DNA helicase DinG
LCSYFRECFYQKIRQKVQAADIIIVNHSLLLSDLKMGEMILPPYQYLVIDEAHHLDEEGTKQFSDVFSLRDFSKNAAHLVRRDINANSGILYYWKKHFASIRNYDEKHAQCMLDNISAADFLHKRLNEVIEDIKGCIIASDLPETTRISEQKRSEKWWQTIMLFYDNLLVETFSLLDCIKRLIAGINTEDKNPEEIMPLHALKTLYSQLKNDYEIVKQFISLEHDAEKVYWIEKDIYRMDLRFHIAPISTGTLFNEMLFSTKASVIMTSATLSVEESFTYVIEQLGIPEELVDTVQLLSPFYYDEQALLLIDSSLPDPAKTSEEAYNLAVAEGLLHYIRVTRGNTLVLFTSHKQIRYMYGQLSEPLRQIGLELFADGVNGRRHTLLSEMKNNPQAVAFGASTFWEGIDLPGDTLKSLIIVRLPFVPPTIPLVEARLEGLEKEGKNAFLNYSLPQAVLRFRQGYGRLIRTIDDSGVVIILDRRLITKRYGRTFINSLPNQKYYAGDMATLVERVVDWHKRV